METDELLELTVDEQKEELQNLDKEELLKLKEAEERNTAIDNIEKQIRQIEHPQGTTETATNIDSKGKNSNLDVGVETKLEKLEELEKKVDYIISRCKTTSQEGFEDYEN